MFTDVVLIVSALSALVPMAMTGARAIHAYTTDQPVWNWVCMGLLCVVMFFVTTAAGVAALVFGMFPQSALGLNGGYLLPAVLACLLALVGPWTVWLVGRRWADGRSRR